MSVDTLSDPVSTFLCQPENIAVALEVARQVEKLRDQLHRSFWPAVEKALKARLESSPHAQRWFIAKPGSYKKNFTNCKFEPRFKPEGRSVSGLFVCFMQGTQDAGFPLNYGIVWSPNVPKGPHGSESYSRMIRISGERGFQNKYANEWWPACQYLDFSIKSDEFLLQYASNPVKFIESIADLIWDYFTVLETDLFAYNQELILGK
jgi:hypothetical protein